MAGRVLARAQRRARRERRTLVFVDESGFYLLPAVVKTYAPKGQTPILDEWQTRDHLSVMGGVTPQGKVYSQIRPKSLNGLHSHRIPRPPGPSGCGSPSCDLGWVSDPSAGRSEGVRGGGR